MKSYLYILLVIVLVNNSMLGQVRRTQRLNTAQSSTTKATASKVILLLPGFSTTVGVPFHAFLSPALSGIEAVPLGKKFDGTDELNFVTTNSYDILGRLTSSGVSYFNSLGKGTQTQSLDIKTGQVWATETRYDRFGRAVLSTMAAPIGENYGFKSDFIKKSTGATYALSDYDTGSYKSTAHLTKENSPTSIGSAVNSLGWYYSDSNIRESLQDKTSYPFTRTVYSKLNPTKVKKTVGGNKVTKDGVNQWLQTYSFMMPIAQEMHYIFGRDYFSRGYILGTKTVVRDVNGIEAVVFKDSEDNTLAAAKSGNEDNANRPKYKVLSPIGEQRFVDIHLPVGCGGANSVKLLGAYKSYKIYDLIAEGSPILSGVNVKDQKITLPSGMYRVEAVPADKSSIELKPYTKIVNGVIKRMNPNGLAVEYKVNYYDYSLNYYDRSGKLKESVQPIGFDSASLTSLKTESQINHTSITTFEYNTLGQLLHTESPDEGKAWFQYRKDGQIRFSQNEKQQLANSFSYTHYDKYARPIESGEYKGSAYTFKGINTQNLVDVVYTYDDINNNRDSFDDVDCQDQLFTKYDEKDVTLLHAELDNVGIARTTYQQHFVAGNVSKTYSQNPNTTTTWYSYDVYGRVEWVLQNIDGLGLKTIDYEYDPITSEVLKIVFQKHEAAETFVHKYSYNLSGELTTVETSTNNVDFTEQAYYQYYETGALKRVELASNLQGIDYVYNLSGQLKAINHPSLSSAKDPGEDGGNGFQADAFGMAIDYYNGDYQRTTNKVSTTLASRGTDQFNGNIKSTHWKNQQTTTIRGQEYTYNTKTNWLEQASMVNVAANGAVTGTNDYKVFGIKYDVNGNIQELKRNGYTDGTNNSMDNFKYEYHTGTNHPNQLKYITDSGDNSNATKHDDLKTQSSANEYVYNEIGQLEENEHEGIKYVYTTSGLVSEVLKNNQPLVKFYYNDKGFRVRKESYNTSGNLLFTEFYIRDASGSTLAVYKDDEQTELPIYGASRLGVYKKSGTTNYELTDHLGNVRAVVSKDSPLKYFTDYYPFGMPMPNRNNINNNYRYAYQGQEKDPETDKEAFELRLWDSRIGRWLTTDPARQYSSPYLGMGNDPISGVDPDGAKKIYFNSDGSKNHTTHDNWFHNTFVGTKNYLSFEGNDYGLSAQGLEVLQGGSFEGVETDFLTRSENGFEDRLSAAVGDYDPSKENILSYVNRESRGGGNLDQKRFFSNNKLYLVTNRALNNNEVGNVIWGAAMNVFGMDPKAAFISNYGGTTILNRSAGNPWFKYDKFEHFEAQSVFWGNMHMQASPHGRQIRNRLTNQVYGR